MTRCILGFALLGTMITTDLHAQGLSDPDITDERILPWMGAGMVSPTLGSNLVLGGDIDLPFGPIFLTLAGSTIHVDDQLVVEDGVLKL